MQASTAYIDRLPSVKFLASAPVAPFAGDCYFDNNTAEMKIYNGRAWATMTSSAGLVTKGYVDSQVGSASCKCSYCHTHNTGKGTNCVNCGAPHG